jgi:hypothetical protein
LSGISFEEKVDFLNSKGPGDGDLPTLEVISVLHVAETKFSTSTILNE